MPLDFKIFDHLNEDPEKLFRLYEKVYGDSSAIRIRWNWEFIQHPMSDKFKFFIAESETGELAGMTVRMPLYLRVGEELYPAFFATNSMVDTAFRGQNLICRLYMLAAEDGALHLSKGTTAPMLRQLRKMGYHVIEPNNYLACLVSPVRWAVGKITGKDIRLHGVRKKLSGFSDYTRIERFTEEFEKVVPKAAAVVEKTADEMNWRYIDPPHRGYHCFARRRNGRVVSWCAIRHDGISAMLADLRWRSEQKDEPRRTIRFAKALARSLGSVKLMCWTPKADLRQTLAREFFIQRKESPGFSFFSRDERWLNLRWTDAHFVHGDGDAEYI